MIYPLLRSVAAVALRWYYADVTIVGSERVPTTGPLLVAVNHPNALVDVLVAGQAVPRRLMFTAKATLFANPVAAGLLRQLGVVPLRRASDEAVPGSVDRSRNAQVFDAIADALASHGAILIFPEGKSHDEPAVAPLRSGAARMAMHAKTTRKVAGIRIVPIGLIFQRKDRPRSRILALVGEPIEVDTFAAEKPRVVADLTAEIDRGIRTLTLNYSTIEEAEHDARLSRTLSALVRYDAPSVGDAGDLRMHAGIARLLPRLRAELLDGKTELRERTMAFEAALATLDQELQQHKVSLADLTISRDVAPGAVFVARELAVFLVAGPVALWGWINHLLPFGAALSAGRRVRHSAADPAMRTILAGAVFVVTIYMLQGAVVTLLAGPWWGLGYVLSLPIAADINLRMQDRLHRALRRARTYLYFRGKPAVHDQLVRQAIELRAEALALAGAIGIVDLN
ncbi:MAG: lysophospholipid acyltransferase family protein [Gemmatimonadaceae bacterium]